MAEQPSRRVELVAESSDTTREAARTGLGLFVGLFLGRNSLLAAANGGEQFEVAIAHFVGLVLVSVAGALFLGAMYDRAAHTAEAAERAAAEEAEPVEEDPSPSPELPIGMPT